MDIIEVRDAGVIASEINYIKRRTCETLLANSVEIGRLLVEAKQKVPTGEWMKWLSENVSYSQSNANNLMRLYEEYGEKEQIGFFEENRLEIFGTLTPSQALALIPLPYEQRREFIETHDMDETSVRDISAEIKAREDAEKRAADADRRASEASESLMNEQRYSDSLEEQIEDMKAKIEELTAEIEEKAEREAEKPEQIDLDAERDAIKAELSAQFEQDKAAAVAEAVAGADEKIAKLKEDLKKVKAAASADVQRFGVVFENFQREGQTLVSLLGKIEDQSVKEKLRGGMRQVMDAYKERVEKA